MRTTSTVWNVEIKWAPQSHSPRMQLKHLRSIQSSPAPLVWRKCHPLASRYYSLIPLVVLSHKYTPKTYSFAYFSVIFWDRSPLSPVPLHRTDSLTAARHYSHCMVASHLFVHLLADLSHQLSKWIIKLLYDSMIFIQWETNRSIESQGASTRNTQMVTRCLWRENYISVGKRWTLQ